MAHSRLVRSCRSLLLWLAAAALLAAVPGRPAACGESAAIRLAPEVGDKIWYKLSMDGTTEMSGSLVGAPPAAGAPVGGQPIPVQIAIVFSVEVKPRDEDSNWVIEQRIHDFEITAMGIDMSQVFAGAKGVPVTITQDKLGNVLKLEGLPAIGGGSPMNPAGFSAITLAPRMLSFPEAEIDVGDTWEVQSSGASKEQLRQAEAEMAATLVSLEEIAGEECAKIKVVTRANPELKGALPGSDATASAKTETDTVYTVRLSDGRILRMEGKMVSEISSGSEGGFGAKNDLKMSMKEIPPPADLGPGSEGG